LYIVIAWARCVGGVIRLLPWGLLGVLLIVLLVPVVWLEGVSLLVECVLGSVVGDASPGPYSFNHLASFGILYGFGLIFVVILREREGNDGV
jgi:hypothetical protein